MRIVFSLCLTLMMAMPALFAAGNAQAQFASGPSTSRFGDNNTQLRTILTLQNQNQLLKKLIERETSVNQMIEAAIAVGISSPFIPAPDRRLCTDVPANIPCAKAYTNLYDDFSVTQRKTAAQLPALPHAPSIMAETDIPDLSARDLSALPKELDSTMTIYWTDITCLGTRCSAVISPDPADLNARYRIMVGEKLPDGSIVRTISASGVTLERDNKPIHLNPAPSA